MSCAGNGYLTGNMLIPFPFEDGQILAWSSMEGEAQRLLERCFVDAGVNLTVDIDDGWPSIGGFTFERSLISFRISAGGKESVATISASSSKFPIVSGKAPFGSYVVVASSEGIMDFLSFCSEKSISPPVPVNSSPLGREGAFLRLCPRCVNKVPAGLKSISVYDGVKTKGSGPHFIMKGDISIKPGNNMLLSEPDGNGIQLDAVPGAGLGTIPCTDNYACAVKSPIMSDDGHTRIFNDTCYDIEPWIEDVKEDGAVVKRIGHIQLHAKCTACCTCDMYESIVNDKLVPLSAIIRQAKADLYGYLLDYEESVNRFNQRLAKPEMSDFILSISGMPAGENLSPKLSETGIKGKMGRCSFTAILRNSSYSVISSTVYSLKGSDSIVEATASWIDEKGETKSKTANSELGIVGNVFNISPGMSLVITFVSVKDDMVGSVKTGGYVGSISVGISYYDEGGASGSLGILSKSVEV